MQPTTSVNCVSADPPGRTGRSIAAEICTVGTELLLGQIVDTNAAYIAQQLANIGVHVYYRSGVGDNLDRMKAVIQLALERSDAVILTGGLGPTRDDLTPQALSELFGAPLRIDTETERRIRDRIQRLNLTVAQSSFRMAMVPEGAVILPNEYGMAPGLWLERDGKIAIALPGVPTEMRHLLSAQVIPRLQEIHPGPLIRSRVLRLVGIAESLAEEKILDLIDAQTNPTIAPYAGSGEVKLRLTVSAATESEARERLDATEALIQSRLGRYCYGRDEESLAVAVGRRLSDQGLTVSTAESCTAGLLTAAITDVPGSSSYFHAGEITYSNEAKARVLGVPAGILEQHGAVSEETARAMAEGVRRLHRADLGISVTGIAGPGGGTAEKPVGLVFVGVSDERGTEIRRHQFGGDRSDVRRRSVNAALQLAFQRLTIHAAGGPNGSEAAQG